MSSEIRNAYPRAILYGTKDESLRAAVAVPEQLPTHLPLVYIFAERGSTAPQILSGDELTTVYGDATFDYKKKFVNLNTVLLSTVNARGNASMVQRVLPEDATKAKFRLSLEVAEGITVPKYKRLADGQWERNSSGALVQDTDDSDVPLTQTGIVYIWHLNYAGQSSAAFGEATVTSAVYPRTSGSASSVYPIFDFEVASYGEYGNRTGLRITAPNALSTSPSDVALARSLKEFIYRFQAVERPMTLSTPNILQTIAGEMSQDLVLAPNVYHPSYGTDLSVDAALIQAYQDTEPSNGPVVIGPFGRLKVYSANINTIRNKYRASEATALTGNSAAWIPMNYADTTFSGLINILNNTDFNGVPYESIRKGTVADSSVVNFDAGQVTTIYASGGADGTVNDANFDLLVRNEINTFGDGAYPLLDDARYPLSVIYDTGFSLDTKQVLPKLIGKRKDTGVILSTYSAGNWIDDPDNVGEKIYVPVTTQLTISEESSIATQLRTALELQPESEVYGTSVCRGMVVGHSGYLINSQWKGLAPLTIDIADKYAAFMGAGNGIWNSQQAPDEPGNNKVTKFRGVNNTYKRPNTYEKDWDNGMIWVQSFDTRSLFWPAYQTVYPNDTSVLNSAIMMFAVIEAEKVCQRVWRELTGNTSLTNEQFIERSNELISDKLDGRFAGRYTFRPETYFTGADLQRGFSWSAKIHVYGANMRTVGQFSVVAHRLEDLVA